MATPESECKRGRRTRKRPAAQWPAPASSTENGQYWHRCIAASDAVGIGCHVVNQQSRHQSTRLVPRVHGVQTFRVCVPTRRVAEAVQNVPPLPSLFERSSAPVWQFDTVSRGAHRLSQHSASPAIHIDIDMVSQYRRTYRKYGVAHFCNDTDNRTKACLRGHRPQSGSLTRCPRGASFLHSILHRPHSHHITSHHI